MGNIPQIKQQVSLQEIDMQFLLNPMSRFEQISNLTMKLENNVTLHCKQFCERKLHHKF